MNMNVQDMVGEAKNSVPAVTCEDFLKMRAEGDNYTLIDVREEDEWNEGHIPEAVHIPRGLLEFKIADTVPDKNAPIVTQCASGGRSALCAETLVKMGYTNVKNLEGGYMGYCDAVKENV